jgi:hypothetical protein
MGLQGSCVTIPLLASSMLASSEIFHSYFNEHFVQGPEKLQLYILNTIPGKFQLNFKNDLTVLDRIFHTNTGRLF